MKDSFEKLVEFGRESLDFDEWIEDNGIEGYCKGIIDEAEEIKQAIENNDIQNLKEEIGDALIDWMHICVLAEKQKGIDPKEIINDAIVKLKRRKPFVSEKRKVTVKEANNIWQEAKKKEKNIKNDKSNNK